MSDDELENIFNRVSVETDLIPVKSETFDTTNAIFNSLNNPEMTSKLICQVWRMFLGDEIGKYQNVIAELLKINNELVSSAIKYGEKEDDDTLLKLKCSAVNLYNFKQLMKEQI